MRLPSAGMIALVVALLCPSAASAVVRLNVERGDFLHTGADQIIFIDVYADDLPPDEDEQLMGFTLALDAPNFSPTGIRFAPLGDPASLTSVDHPYVFGGIPGGELHNVGSTYNRIHLVAALSDSADAVDITPTRNGLGRIPVIIPADIPLGFFPVLIATPPSTSLAAPGGEPIPFVVGPPGGILTPEPATAGLGVVCAAALLRRRRR